MNEHSTVFQWLVERGQPEGEQQPVWLKHTATVLADEGKWTNDANDAACFPTRKIAEEWIAEHDLTARSVEHGFMWRPSREDRLEAALERIRAVLNPDYPEWRIANEALMGDD